MEVAEVKRLKSLEEENARLKKLLAEAMLEGGTSGGSGQKVLTTDQKQEAVEFMCAVATSCLKAYRFDLPL
jgi:putative transposase